jgi:hypothetical protein
METQQEEKERLGEGTVRRCYVQFKTASEEIKPFDTLILDFQPREQWEMCFCCLSYLVWGILLWEPQQTNALFKTIL